jgi:PAS domain S-box-containing protein
VIRELDALHQLVRGMRGQVERQALLQSIVDCGRELLGASAVAAGLQDPVRPAIMLRAHSGAPAPLEWPLHRDPITDQAFRQNQTVIDNPPSDAAASQRPFRATLAVPLCHEGRPVGVLAAGHADGAQFSSGDARTLESLTWLAELALGNAERTLEVTRRIARVEALQSITQELQETQDLDAIVNQALTTAITLFGADRGAVWLGGTDQPLRCIVSRGLSEIHLETIAANYTRAAAWSMLRALRPVMIEDMRTTRLTVTQPVALREGVRAALLTPLVYRHELTGVLSLYHDINWNYTDEDLALAGSFGQQLGVAVAHAQLLAEAKQQVGRIGVLFEIGRAGAETLELQGRCERSAHALVSAGGLDSASIWLLSPDGHEMRRVAAEPESDGDADRIRMAEDTIVSRAVAGVRAVSSDEPSVIRLRATVLADSQHAVAVPMVHQGRVVGALVGARRQRQLGDADIEFLRASANQVAASAEHARVFHRLAETTAHLSAVLRCVPDGILVFGPDHRINYFNQVAQHLYGLEGRDLMGWSPDDFDREVARNFADPKIAREIARRVREEPDHPSSLEFVLVRPSRRVIVRTSAPVRGEAGQLMGQVIIFHDITQLRDSERGHAGTGNGGDPC